MLEITNLSCVRGDKPLIEDLSFDLSEGQLLHITGRNGAGKTTLLRCLCGLSSAAAGQISWLGQNIETIRDSYHAQMAYVGHLNGHQGELTAVENLVFARALGAAQTDTTVTGTLKKLGLYESRLLPTKFLSQGQQRRLALARLLIQKRKLWIMDEPFVALDTDSTALLEGIVSDHIKNGGLAILTSHHALNLTQSRQLNIDRG